MYTMENVLTEEYVYVYKGIWEDVYMGICTYMGICIRAHGNMGICIHGNMYVHGYM